jgi:ParB family chromosome partitioning protein
MTTVAIDAIRIGERSRTEMRDIESLARSIRERGMLHPPVVRRVGKQIVLVAGQRRIAAARQLGWDETPVTFAESVHDEIEALYAEGEENTEREPFTAAEAVAHRRRIHDAIARQAKERQGERTDLQPSANLAPSQPAHERKTRTRTARATGFGHTSLDKAERVVSLAEDETQPEPVRKVAKQAAENLAQHGAKVDREFKAVEQAVAENSDHAQAYQDAQWRKNLAKELGRLVDLRTFPPERVIAICDDDLLFLIDRTCNGVAEWHAAITQLRQPGLRVVPGGST